MPETVFVRGNGGEVQVEVLDYERPTSKEGSDANWLVCRCRVTVREFISDVRLSLMSDDFVRFLRNLDDALRSLRGTAVFATAEEGLALEVRFKAAGHADVSGIVQSQLSVIPSRTNLDFSFESDQSFLSETVKGLRALIQRFPVRSFP